MQPDDWIVLVESRPPQDESGLLYLEAVLQEAGIETLFDPRRPGEWVSAGYGGLREVRLLVMQRDLERAQQIVEDLESAGPGEIEDEASPALADEDGGGYQHYGAATKTSAPDVDPRVASFKPPMDKAINPGCGTLLLPVVMVLGLLILW